VSQVPSSNPHFRVWSSAAQPAGYPDEIVWRLGLSPDDLDCVGSRIVSGWRLRAVSFDPPAAHLDELRIRFPGQLHSNPAMETDFFFLNTRAKPFDDVRVRRALNYALDRARIVEIYGGPAMAQPTCQILPPQMPGFSRYCPYSRGPRRDGRWRAPDVPRARRLVAASGTKGMIVKVWSTPTPTIARDQGRYVTAVLRQLGYRASLRLLPDAAFLRYSAGTPRRRRGATRATRAASGSSRSRPSTSRSDGAVDRDGLLQTLFPDGIPAKENVIRSLNSWLDEAERLARMR